MNAQSRLVEVACTLGAWLLLALVSPVQGGSPIVYPGGAGPGHGKQIVFLTGDEEYRSEEGLPMLAKILSQRHGFKCTVVFAVNPADGTIDPNNQTNLVGMESLDTADLVIMLWRFREPSDDKMKHFVDYFLAGKPFIALRTSTHSFAYGRNKKSPYARYDWSSHDWPGGFGRQVLGETWVAHHGDHKHEATRGIVEEDAKDHPVLRGVHDIFGDTDVYTANPLPDSKILVRGQVLTGMNPADPPVVGKKNSPMQPVIWVREYKNEAGTVNKILTTTMGASTDLQNEGLRRLLVNAAYWTTGLEAKISPNLDVSYVGEYKPTMYGFGGFTKGVKPEDHELKH